MPPYTIAQGRIVIEYQNRKIYFSQGGDLGVTSGDAITYAIPETGERAKLAPQETWDTMEITRPYDSDADAFFYWCQTNKPFNRYVSAAEELPGARLQVFAGARVASYRRTGLDQESDEIKRLTVVLEYDKAVAT